MKKRKTLLWTLLVVLLLLSVGVFTLVRKNVAAMDGFVETALDELNAHYTVTALDPGEYRELKLFGLLKFKVEQYDVAELGNVSISRVNMGLMQMATALFNKRDFFA